MITTFKDDTFGFNLISIPEIQFTIGYTSKQFSPRDCEIPAHVVRLDAFSIAQYPTTCEQYMRFINDDSKNKVHEPEWLKEEFAEKYKNENVALSSPNLPITGINYRGAVAYCEWLTQETGEYYRLPTSAEWECAARSGTDTDYYYGNNPALLNNYAWSAANSDNQLQEVGKKIPNYWGLYDTLGLVWEITSDIYKEFYYRDCAKQPVTLNPKGPDPFNSKKNDIFDVRVTRGGSFLIAPRFLRVSFRYMIDEFSANQDIGFRVVVDKTQGEFSRYVL